MYMVIYHGNIGIFLKYFVINTLNIIAYVGYMVFSGILHQSSYTMVFLSTVIFSHLYLDIYVNIIAHV